MKKGMGAAARLCTVFLCLLLALGGLTGCSHVTGLVSGVAAGNEFPVTIGDVTISSRPARAVVLSAGLADVIVALRCETQLIAGSRECTQASLKELDKVDGDSAQTIIDLNPDLVLTDGTSRIENALAEAGITVLPVALATDREDFERMYSQVSAAFCGGDSGYNKGVKAAQDIFTTMDDINRIVPKDKVTTACYLYDTDSHAITGDMFGSTIMSYAGVTNVFQNDVGGTFEFDTLRVVDPDVIFCVPGLKDTVMTDPRFSDFRAVRDKRVFELAPRFMEWLGRTVIMGAYSVSGSCFPELLETNSMVVTDPTQNIDSQVSSAIAESIVQADTTKYETLKPGDENENVLKLQTRLEALGYLDEEYTGYYGEVTGGCVKAFQEMNGLEVTGIADPETQRKLYSVTAKDAGGKTQGDQETAQPQE